MEEPTARFNEFKKFLVSQFSSGNVEELVGCKKCNSTGLIHWSSIFSNNFGTNGEFCGVCNGTGVTRLELKTSSGIYLCKKCKGYGYLKGKKCENCKGKGKIDWLENILDGGFDK